MICVSHAAQNKLTPTQQADLSVQVKVAPLHFLKPGASAPAGRHFTGVHFN